MPRKKKSQPKKARPTKPGKRARKPPQSEAEFLAAYDAGEFARPSVAVDVVVLTLHEGALHTVVVRRTEHPFRDRHALPGGFVAIDESLDAAAARVLARKAGLEGVYLEQLYSFGAPGRDPRTRVISIAYYALVDHARLATAAESFPETMSLARVRVPWEGETGGPVDVVDAKDRPLELAFDHADILGVAIKRIRGKLDYTPVGFQLLPETFTLRAVQEVHETILDRPLNKDSFRRKMLAAGQLEATGAREQDVEHRPAELYRFHRRSAV